MSKIHEQRSNTAQAYPAGWQKSPHNTCSGTLASLLLQALKIMKLLGEKLLTVLPTAAGN